MLLISWQNTWSSRDNSCLTFDHNIMSLFFLCFFLSWLLVMLRWIANRAIAFSYSIVSLNKRFQLCFLMNAVVNLIMNVLSSSIDQNMQTALKTRNHIIFELTRRLESLSIALIISLKKIQRRIIVWWKMLRFYQKGTD